MKHSKRVAKLHRRIQAWENISSSKMVGPSIKEANRSQGTNTFRKPGSQKK